MVARNGPRACGAYILNGRSNDEGALSRWRGNQRQRTRVDKR